MVYRRRRRRRHSCRCVTRRGDGSAYGAPTPGRRPSLARAVTSGDDRRRFAPPNPRQCPCRFVYDSHYDFHAVFCPFDVIPFSRNNQTFDGFKFICYFSSFTCSPPRCSVRVFRIDRIISARRGKTGRLLVIEYNSHHWWWSRP